MCKSCESVSINGVLCHELGCPDAYQGKEIECKNCDNHFIPEEKTDKFCCELCYLDYYGLQDANAYEIDDNAMSYNETYVGQAQSKRINIVG